MLSCRFIKSTCLLEQERRSMNNLVQRRDRKFVKLGLKWLVGILVLCAIVFGQVIPQLRRILERRNQQRGDEESPKLLRAAKEGNHESARLAIFAGADVNCNPFGETPLGHAIVGRNMQLISILLESSADPDGIFRQETAPIGTVITPLTYAVQNNDIAVARVLLDAGADPNIGSGLPGPFPLLCWCIDKDYLEMLDLLIEHGANIEADGRAAMDFAVRLGNSAAGDLFARHGASYTVREAVAFNRLDDVKEMVEKNPALFHERFTTGDSAFATTLLGVALSLGHREMAEFLIESGASVDVLEHGGSTLLHKAAIGGDAELVKCLIARNLDINAQDNSKETPLHDAVRWDHLEVVKVLIAAGADIKETVLQLAINKNNSDVVRLLLEAGADTSSEKLRTLLETKLERKPNNEGLFKVLQEFGLVQ
jgi:ankyrin repeat protein